MQNQIGIKNGTYSIVSLNVHLHPKITSNCWKKCLHVINSLRYERTTNNTKIWQDGQLSKMVDQCNSSELQENIESW